MRGTTQQSLAQQAGRHWLHLRESAGHMMTKGAAATRHTKKVRAKEAKAAHLMPSTCMQDHRAVQRRCTLGAGLQQEINECMSMLQAVCLDAAHTEVEAKQNWLHMTRTMQPS